MNSRRDLWKVVVGTLVALVVIDGLVGQLVHHLKARHGANHPLVRYFDYGRSVEAKLDELALAAPKEPGSVFHAGWIAPEKWRQLSGTEPLPQGQRLMAVYGQSFSFRMARAFQAQAPGWELRLIGAPSAPLSHALAAYRADQSRARADVVMVGVLASSLCASSSISGLSLSFESPTPYTYPGIEARAGSLVERQPILNTEAEFSQALLGRTETWDAFKRALRQADARQDSFRLDASVLDQSMLVRLARRGWVASRADEPPHGGSSARVPACMLAHQESAWLALSAMQQMAKARGETLLVALIQDRGHAGSLTSILRPSLERAGVAFLDSADVVNSDDANQFESDGHFKHAVDVRFGEHLREQVQALLAH